MTQQYGMAVWWATPVEMRSAFERLLRMGQLTPSEYADAGTRLEKLRRGWRELQPSEALRAQAETFLMSHPLKAADALQLAAALTWCAGNSRVLRLHLWRHATSECRTTSWVPNHSCLTHFVLSHLKAWVQ